MRFNSASRGSSDQEVKIKCSLRMINLYQETQTEGERISNLNK